MPALTLYCPLAFSLFLYSPLQQNSKKLVLDNVKFLFNSQYTLDCLSPPPNHQTALIQVTNDIHAPKLSGHISVLIFFVSGKH
jgi:hypothetical protein